MRTLQINEQVLQIEYKTIKNLNWREADLLDGFMTRSRRRICDFQEKSLNSGREEDLNQGHPDIKNHSVAPPRPWRYYSRHESGARDQCYRGVAIQSPGP